MDAQSFSQKAVADGFAEPYARDLSVASDPAPHAHDFDARVMVTDGAITLGIDGKKTTYAAGDWCEVPAGTIHTEEVGPHGVSLLVAKRSS
tara:strand:+ start:527 stop:799 length:273 start_codon:yes stop_codon:yes gene_type:complete